MSKGPGVWQRRILDRIEVNDIFVLTDARHTKSEQSAIRRAAKQLEDAGRLRITSMNIDGHARLVAAALTSTVPAPRLVTGLDGKTYRRPLV